MTHQQLAVENMTLLLCGVISTPGLAVIALPDPPVGSGAADRERGL
jgi:hypothetical protein